MPVRRLGANVPAWLFALLLVFASSWSQAAWAMRGAFHSQSFGGDIDLNQAPEGARLTVFGGNIHIGSMGGRVNATAFGGNVRLDEVDGSADVTAFGGDVRLALASAVARGRSVEVNSLGGDVTLMIPAGFSASIDVKLECQRRNDDCRIESDLPLMQSVGPWHRSLILLGSRRRTIRAWGKLGDGVIPIRIRAYGGTVRLVREPEARAAR